MVQKPILDEKVWTTATVDDAVTVVGSYTPPADCDVHCSVIVGGTEVAGANYADYRISGSYVVSDVGVVTEVVACWINSTKESQTGYTAATITDGTTIQVTVKGGVATNIQWVVDIKFLINKRS